MRVALDTNILAYVEGVNSAVQKAAATALVARLPARQTVLPVQVLGELFAVLTRKSRRTPAEARLACTQWMTGYDVIPTTTEVLGNAFVLAEAHRIAGWDAVILAAAAQAGCRFLLSEDMHDGFSWRGVTVANPFASGPLPAALTAILDGSR